jgi:hypothetical protein
MSLRDICHLVNHHGVLPAIAKVVAVAELGFGLGDQVAQDQARFFDPFALLQTSPPLDRVLAKPLSDLVCRRIHTLLPFEFRICK